MWLNAIAEQLMQKYWTRKLLDMKTSSMENSFYDVANF